MPGREPRRYRVLTIWDVFPWRKHKTKNRWPVAAATAATAECLYFDDVSRVHVITNDDDDWQDFIVVYIFNSNKLWRALGGVENGKTRNFKDINKTLLFSTFETFDVHSEQSRRETR